MAARDFSSSQMKDIRKADIRADADAAAKRLSKGIAFRTIYGQDRNDFDEQAFRDWHQYLVYTYPLVHKTLKREIVGLPRPFSLLCPSEGKKPSLPPMMLMDHQDVVPIVPGAESRLVLFQAHDR